MKRVNQGLNFDGVSGCLEYSPSPWSGGEGKEAISSYHPRCWWHPRAIAVVQIHALERMTGRKGTDCHHWLPPEGQGEHLIPLQHTPARLVSKKESLAPSNEQQCSKHTRATFLSPCAIKNLSSL